MAFTRGLLTTSSRSMGRAPASSSSVTGVVPLWVPSGVAAPLAGAGGGERLLRRFVGVGTMTDAVGVGSAAGALAWVVSPYGAGLFF